MNILRILIVVFSVVNICPSFAGGVQDTMSAAQTEQNTVRVKVQDGKGKPISGLVVTTTNVQPKYETTTDTSGVARFEDKCSSYANLGREGTPVHIRISDPDKKYKTVTQFLAWDDRTGQAGCARTIILNDNYIRETFPTPEQLKLAFDNRTGKLKFYDICTSGQKPGGSVQSGCITAFKKVQVQITEAIFLATEYMRKKIIPETDTANLAIECNPLPVRTVSHQDFLTCTSAGGKYAYDFEFDDLIESSDNEILTRTTEALCTILNDGTFDVYNSYRMCQKQSATETKTMCSYIRGQTSNLSWTTEFHQNLTVGYDTTVDDYGGESNTPITRQNVCVFNFRDANKNYEPRNIPEFNLDIRKYEYITMRSLPSLEFLMRQFTEAQMREHGYQVDSFRCAQGFRKWNSPGGDKHLLECHITYKTSGSSQSVTNTVDFVFDDINVRGELKSNAGEGGMWCIAQGGSFDGSKCHGLTKEECTTLNNQIPGGTKWDESIYQCTLNDANTLANRERLKDVALMGVALAGAAVAVVATGGTGAPAVLVVLTDIGAGLTIGGTAIAESTGAKMSNQMEKFKQKYDTCKNQKIASEQDACARSVLRTYLGYVDTYLESNVFDGQEAKALNEIFVNLVEMTEPNKITKADVQYYSLKRMNAQTLARLNTVAKDAALVGDFMLIFAGGAMTVKQLAAKGLSITANGTKAVATATKGTKASKFFARVWNLSSKTVNKANDTYTIVNNTAGLVQATDIPSTQRGACWVDGALAKCT